MTLISSSQRWDAGRIALGCVVLLLMALLPAATAQAQLLDLNGPPPAPTLRGVSPAGSTLHAT